MGWCRVLVLTYKPAVQTAWRDDLLSHIDFEGWRFVDRDTPDADRDAYADGPDPLVWFASFQDLHGRTPDGDVKAHNEVVHLIDWDCIVIDEYHFGAWRDTARELYDPSDKSIAEVEEPEEAVTEDDLGLGTRYQLYLSGTPFRAITSGEFTEDQIFNWTYVDEQREKAGWDASRGPNPHLDLPRMEMYSDQMGPDAEGWALDGEFIGFSLGDYFKADKVTAAHGVRGSDNDGIAIGRGRGAGDLARSRADGQAWGQTGGRPQDDLYRNPEINIGDSPREGVEILDLDLALPVVVTGLDAPPKGIGGGAAWIIRDLRIVRALGPHGHRGDLIVGIIVGSRLESSSCGSTMRPRSEFQSWVTS